VSSWRAQGFVWPGYQERDYVFEFTLIEEAGIIRVHHPEYALALSVKERSIKVGLLFLTQRSQKPFHVSRANIPRHLFLSVVVAVGTSEVGCASAA